MSRYPFPLCIQLTPPENLFEDGDFAQTLSLLRELGFHGVELNLLDFSQPDRLEGFLSGFGLRLTMVATGFYAGRNGLSLSAADEDTRLKTVRALEDILRFAAACKAGIICGFVKGGPGQDKAAATLQMERSLSELCAANESLGAEIYLEATNHYEAALVNTMREGRRFCDGTGGKIRILPDTYHMNIEEPSPAAALAEYRSLYRNVHVSDNNRYFPGFGAIDFFQVCALLRALEYDGTISIEGRVSRGLREDIAASAACLEEIARRLERCPA